jgi:hypothetical protein
MLWSAEYLSGWLLKKEKPQGALIGTVYINSENVLPSSITADPRRPKCFCPAAAPALSNAAALRQAERTSSLYGIIR